MVHAHWGVKTHHMVHAHWGVKTHHMVHAHWGVKSQLKIRYLLSGLSG